MNPNGLTNIEFATELARSSFNGAQWALSDKVLTEGELREMCANAESYLEDIFPGKMITIVPASMPDTEYAGFTITFDGVTDGPFTMDYGAQGVDVRKD